MPSPTLDRPKPFVLPEFCKGCARCIDVCPKDCIKPGTEINPQSGLTPVVLDLAACSACGLCIAACPEPFGLRPQTEADFELVDPKTLLGPRPSTAPAPLDIPDELLPLPELAPLVIKGNHAAAIGALLGSCRHVYGYPITPSTEGAELMAKVLPQLDGVFIQAVSEVATVNHMYGCGGAGLRCLTFTSSPGFSLMLEGISYMIGAEVPGVFINVMRGGPGLGNIGPEQADLKLAIRGLGHGNTHAIVLAPATPQEMLDLTRLALDLTFRYRNPVVVVSDGYLGQMTGRVNLPRTMVKPGLPAWSVWGDAAHRRNLICSILLAEAEQEVHNQHLLDKYAAIGAAEQRADLFHCDDAETLLIACNTPAQIAKGAVQDLRQAGHKVGLFRPITLWPFPLDLLKPLLPHLRRIVVVEASPGQLEDELRLALSYAGIVPPLLAHIQHYGGVLPAQREIVEHVLAGTSVEGTR